jgi:hypothetical protein
VSRAAVQPSAEALAWARGMAASIADNQERALVTQVIETVTEGRKLPGWGVMTPLMRAAALALQGKTRPWEDQEPEPPKVRELTARRKADRAEMARQVAALAGEYGLAARYEPEQAGTRRASVDLAGPYGLKLTVTFDANGANGPDTYVLSWHGVEDGWRLSRARFSRVNEHHGHKATDVARGFGALYDLLLVRFTDIADGSAFIAEAGR